MERDASREEAFSSIERRLLREPDTETGTIFRSRGLKAHGGFFAFLGRDGLVLKLPVARCRELLEAGSAREFRSGRRVMREWVTVPEPDVAAWLELAEEALEFARRLRGARSPGSAPSR